MIRHFPETVEELMQFSMEWGWPLNRKVATHLFKGWRFANISEGRNRSEGWKHWLLQEIRELYAKYGEPLPRPEPRPDRCPYTITFTPTTIYEVGYTGVTTAPPWLDGERSVRVLEERRAHLENDEVLI